jgi:hypothetical protein
MNVNYGKTEEYKFSLDLERLNWLSDRTNRSKGQTQFLFQLVDGDFEKLKELEMKIKNTHSFYCPGDTSEVEKLLNEKTDNEWFKL